MRLIAPGERLVGDAPEGHTQFAGDRAKTSHHRYVFGLRPIFDLRSSRISFELSRF
ncbi:MAG: hypothetical protein GPOALKHO_001584 [Sodalis sp.]|nr:MAG: hypothetical protein GPOALKHO_001584 [Sodalis sp.]